MLLVLLLLLGVAAGLPLVLTKDGAINLSADLFFAAVIAGICAISTAALVLLGFRSFSPHALLALLAPPAALGLFRLRQRRPRFAARRGSVMQALVLAAVLLLALFLRFPAAHYAFGGQDQGIYVATGHQIARSGHEVVKDPLLGDLGEDSFLGTHYLKHNYRWARKDSSGEWSGVMLPGLYVSDLDRAELVPQFYRLHTLWIAISAAFLGPPEAVSFLPWFGTLLAAAVFLLTRALSGSSAAALGAALLAAVNPALAYFARLPVSETSSALFFVSGLLFYVLSQERKPGLLALSAWCFGCLFFTRITGFVIMPLLLLLAAYRLLFICEARRRRALIAFGFGVLILYAASWGYGLFRSEAYATEIYRIYLGLGPQPADSAALVVFPLLFFLAATAASSAGHRPLRRIVAAAARRRGTLVSLMLCLYAAALVWRGWQIAYSDAFRGDPWLDIRWKIAGGGLKSLEHFSAIVLAGYLTIGGALCAGFGLKSVMERSFYTSRYTAFSLLFLPLLLLLTLKKHSVPYSYYYGRYLVSEVLPLAVVLAAIGSAKLLEKIKRPPLRRAAAFALALAVFAPSLKSAFEQARRTELEGFFGSLAQLQQEMPEKSLILIDSREAPAERLATSLRLVFGRTTYIFSWQELQRRGFHRLAAYFADRGYSVYLLSARSGWERSPAIEKNGDFNLGRLELIQAPGERLPETYIRRPLALTLYSYLPAGRESGAR